MPIPPPLADPPAATAPAGTADASPDVDMSYVPAHDDLLEAESLAALDDLPVPIEPPEEGSDQIQAYAKLEFPGFSYYLQTLDVLIGRRPGNPSAPPPQRITDARPEGGVDVDLGPLKSISRHHARIYYSAAGVPLPHPPGPRRHDEDDLGPALKDGAFVLQVLGRNGAFVDDVYHDRGTCVLLSKRCVTP